MDIKNDISLIICTRNRKAAILPTLESVLANRDSHSEIIVVDQSEAGDTKAAIAGKGDNRIRYVPTTTVGLASARNIGVIKATSDYIIMTDDDCLVPGIFIDRFRQAFSTQDRPRLVFGSVLPCPHDDTREFVPSYILKRPFLARNIFDKTRAEGIGACMGFQKGLWQELGGFDERLGVGAEFKAGEETDFAIRAILHKEAIFETPDISVIHQRRIDYENAESTAVEYWYGTGVVFGKLFRVAPVKIAGLLIVLGIRSFFVNSPVATGFNRQSLLSTRIRAFSSGITVGFKTPVNKVTNVFM